MAAEPSVSALLQIPRWLTRAEKHDFRRIEKLRSGLGKSLSDADIDPLCDLVSARARLGEMRLIWRKALKEAKEYPYSPQQRHALAVARQIDQATAKVRQMARDLHLGPNEA